MKNFFVRALGAAFCFATVLNTVSAQDLRTATMSNDGGALVAAPVTTKIMAKNDAVKVDIKSGSIDYLFYSADAKGNLTLVKSGHLAEPSDKNSLVDLNLSKPGSESIVLIVTGSSDESVVVSVVPDAAAPTAASTKEIISTDNYAVIDIKTKTSVDYELWVKDNPFSDFVKDEKQSGTIPAPTDLNLLDDMVLGDADAYEIKVVVVSPQGDGSASVLFSETKPQK
ncbi:MAG: hypothetical protein ABMA02_10425 [Saprospiraceae bacterium]